MNRIERTPMYLLGQLDAVLPPAEIDGPWPAFRQAFVEMYDLLVPAERSIAGGPDDDLAQEIRAFLRGESPEVEV